MQALNNAIEGADVFMKFFKKLEGPAPTPAQVADAASRKEIAEWNARIEREHAEKRARKAAAKT